MRLLKTRMILSTLLIGLSLYSSAQNSTDTLITSEYLSGVWTIHRIDKVFDKKQELKVKFSGKEDFEQWIEINGKVSDIHKGAFKIKDNSLILITPKGQENVFSIIQVSLMSLRLKEKTAKDIITFVRN